MAAHSQETEAWQASNGTGRAPAPRKSIHYWKSDRPSVVSSGSARRKIREDMESMLLGELRRVFPDKKIALRPAGGQGNHITYFADIGDLRGFLRVEDGPEGMDCMEMEARIIRAVRDAGVPAPAIHALDADRRRVPFAWQVLERVDDPDLNIWNKADDLDFPKVGLEIGRSVGKWQKKVPTRGFGLFNPLEEGLTGYHDDYPTYYYLHFDRHLAFLRENDFLTRGLAATIADAVREHGDLLQLEKSCLVHKDLALWNILGRPDKITAFIDWEDAVGGDPMDDFSLLGCFHSGLEVMRALEGYQEILPLPAEHRRRFWLHLLRNMLVKAVIRIGLGYFQRRDDLFLIGSGATGQDLKAFTRERLETALDGLRENRDIADL